MKNVKRFIAALMATVVVATLSGISAFATKTYPGVEDASDLGVGTYLCFGDSIATGYLSEQSGEDFKSINIAQTLRDGEKPLRVFREQQHSEKQRRMVLEQRPLRVLQLCQRRSDLP